MTGLTYDIIKDGKIVYNEKSYRVAQEFKKLMPEVTIKAVYTPFNPEETAEVRSNLRKHAVKAAEKRTLKE